MLVDPGSVIRALLIVSPDDFYREAHQTICRAIVTVNAAKDPVDAVTVGAELRRLDRLEELGGAEYLHSLWGQAETVLHVVRYATIVREKSILRKLIQVAGEVQEAARQNPENVTECLASSMARMREVTQEAASGEGSQPVADTTAAMVERIEAQIASDGGIVGARFGIPQVDRALGGLQGWGLTVILADTKHGKSLLAGQAALASARHFRDQGNTQWVFVYALEAMAEIEERSLAWLGGFRKSRLEARGATMSEEEWGQYHAAVGEWAGLPLTMTDRITDIDQIILDVEAQQLAGRSPGLIVVDHAQRIKGGEGDVRNQKLADAAEKLAGLSRDCRCPVLLPSQVTINPKGGERTPMHSRGIAQECSLIIDLQRGNGKDARVDWAKLTAPVSRRSESWEGAIEIMFDGVGGTAKIYDYPGWLATGRSIPIDGQGG